MGLPKLKDIIMKATFSLGIMLSSYFVSCLLLLAFVGAAGADPKPLSKEEQAKVDKAIGEGVAYLKGKQTEEGDWPKLKIYWSDQYLVGQCLLPAYALLEAEVPSNDPVVQKAAEFIRPRILKSEETYEIALAVLFFDRLGKSKDEQLIRNLALRLVAGQHYTGGWNYRCPSLRETDESNLVKLLGELTKILKSTGTLNAESLRALQVPRQLKHLTVFQDPHRLKWVEPHSTEFGRHTQLFVGTTDNSNTQFAMLGLWVAQRHGIPMEPTFCRMVERFEKTQRKDGWWPYDLRFDRRNPFPSKSMICVGLMGLAIGHGLTPALSKTKPVEIEDDILIHGLAALYKEIGFPSGQMNKPVPIPKMRYLLYFLWSVERTAMLYNLQTIADKEWYRWGAEIIISSQMEGGEWQVDCGPIVDTSFALLFLKRSHPMKDLTPKLRFTAKELNEGIARLQSSGRYMEGSMEAPSRDKKSDR
jgi:hypothetical protein